MNELNGVVLEGYNILGDGTPQALFPILTGHTEQELPEARWSHEGAQQGKYEERLPFFGIRMPTWFVEMYPEASDNLRKNAFRLTTAFDMHETFHHLIHFQPGQKLTEMQRGISLFKEVPAERTCADASIEPHWCACLDSKVIKTDDGYVVIAAQTLVSGINELNKQST